MPSSQPQTLEYQSNWKSLRLGLLGWVILVIGAVGFTYLLRRYFVYANDFESWNFWAWFIIAQQMLFLVLGFYMVWKSYLPSQWKTALKLHLDEKKLEIITAEKTDVFPFERINCIVFKAVSPIFAIYYLYWAEVGQERIPLIAFSTLWQSNNFFDLLIRRAGLRVEQEPSSP
ncbi:MAG: hypothetical protein ACKVT2_07670 [Saprospiraceae bacterium]